MSTIVWYSLKGKVDGVEVALNSLVLHLKDAIKARNQNDLQHVDARNLTIKTSPEGEALRGDTGINRIDGVTYDNPLYLDFPEVEEPPVKRPRAEQALVACCQMLTNLGDMQPVTLSAAGNETRGTDWNRKVREHYGTGMCIVLSSLFPSTQRPAWFRDDPSFDQVQGAYPAVAEHIVPKGQPTVALIHGVDIHSATNGLPLLRHLERQYQAGNWTLLPTQQDCFQVHVAHHLKPEVIRYYPPAGDAEHRVKDDRNQVLDFRRLHEQVVHFSWMKVSFRALFLKAKMAHKQNPELPNPADFMDRFTGKCQKMKIELWQRLQASAPDPALPVVEEDIVEEQRSVGLSSRLS